MSGFPRTAGASIEIREDGVALATRAGLNFVEGLGATDDAAGDESDVRTRTFLSVPVTGGDRTFTNLGAGPVETSATVDRALMDLTNADEVRHVARVATVFVTGNMKLQYSTDGAVWADLTLGLDNPTTIGLKSSTWQAVPAGALGLVIIRMVGFGGNGVEDPVVGAGVCVEYR